MGRIWLAERPPFDPQRAAFLIIAVVVGVYAIIVLGLVGACIYHSEIIIKGGTDINCDPYNRIMGLLAAALSAALALVGIRGNGKDKNGKDDHK
jgi:small neutral amino acid transporter SnatA (MarC family)